jgi:hypothetical protein
LARFLPPEVTACACLLLLATLLPITGSRGVVVPEDLEALLRRLRLPHIRRHAPEVMTTAKVQRWEPGAVTGSAMIDEGTSSPRSCACVTRTRTRVKP